MSAGLVNLILESTSNGACQATFDTVFVIITAPPVAHAGVDQFVCKTSNIQLTGFVTGGNNSGICNSNFGAG